MENLDLEGLRIFLREAEASCDNEGKMKIIRQLTNRKIIMGVEPYLGSWNFPDNEVPYIASIEIDPRDVKHLPFHIDVLTLKTPKRRDFEAEPSYTML